jgi:hypothetical protein
MWSTKLFSENIDKVWNKCISVDKRHRVFSLYGPAVAQCKGWNNLGRLALTAILRTSTFENLRVQITTMKFLFWKSGISLDYIVIVVKWVKNKLCLLFHNVIKSTRCDGGHVCLCFLAFIYLFMCVLIKEGVSSSEYISLNTEMVSE